MTANIWKAACDKNIFEKQPVTKNILKAANDQIYLKVAYDQNLFE